MSLREAPEQPSRIGWY